MAVPDYQTLMLPLLKFFGDGLMINYDIGVTTVNSYHIKRIDTDFFMDG